MIQMHQHLQILVVLSSFFKLQCNNLNIANFVPFIPTTRHSTNGLSSSTDPVHNNVTTQTISDNSATIGVSTANQFGSHDRAVIPYRRTTPTVRHATTTYLATNVTTDRVHNGTITQQVLLAKADIPYLSTGNNFADLIVRATQPVNEPSTNANIVDGETVSDIEQMKSLLESLFDDYDKRLRPKHDQSKSLVVGSSFVPHTVIELDTQQQIFSVNGYFKIHWTDELLQWDSDAYNLKKNIRVPANLIWIPRIKIAKNLYSKGVVGSQATDIVLLRDTGEVMWWPEGIYSIACQVDITYYPYDKQRCTFTYYVDDEDASTVQLELLKSEDGVDMTEFVDNAEWKVVHTSRETRLLETVLYIDYHFDLERREQFATLTLIIPAIAISLLCTCTFLVPVDTGEKGTVSMNVFLSCCLYMTMLVVILPHNSLTHSYFLLYITILLCFSVFLIFYAILQAKIYHVYIQAGCSCLSAQRGRLTMKSRVIHLMKTLDTLFFVLTSVGLVCSCFALMFVP